MFRQLSSNSYLDCLLLRLKSAQSNISIGFFNFFALAVSKTYEKIFTLALTSIDKH